MPNTLAFVLALAVSAFVAGDWAFNEAEASRALALRMMRLVERLAIWR
jgi:hypothetical protein